MIQSTGMSPRAIFTTEQIAHVCHDANASLCRVLGDQSQLSWEDAPEWQRESAVKGVEFAVDHPDAPESAQHDALTHKRAEDWTYGPVKDPDKKGRHGLIAELREWRASRINHPSPSFKAQ